MNTCAKMLVEWLDKKPEEWIDAQEGLGEIYAQAQVGLLGGTMFDLQKFNDLLGTNFASIDEITDHQLLAALVALTAASLGVSIFVCNPTTGAGDVLRCGHSAGIEFGESSWVCVVCRQPARP